MLPVVVHSFLLIPLTLLLVARTLLLVAHLFLLLPKLLLLVGSFGPPYVEIIDEQSQIRLAAALPAQQQRMAYQASTATSGSSWPMRKLLMGYSSRLDVYSTATQILPSRNISFKTVLDLWQTMRGGGRAYI